MHLDLLVQNCDRAWLYLGGHSVACVSQLVEFWSLVERGVVECESVLDLHHCQRRLMITDAVCPPFAGLIKNERMCVWDGSCRGRCSGTQIRDNTNGAQIRQLYVDG